MRFKNKGIATVVVLLCIIGTSITTALIAKHYLGPDSVPEQISEKILDEGLEELTGAPEGSIDIDVSPNA